jgi:lipopolysaccharide/colanic/teichoic acid biosynthesis glycosyltransferase
LTRLAGIPRSIPFLQVLILAAGLVAARSVMMLFDKDAKDASVAHPDLHEVENIIMIGATRLSSLFIKMLRAQSPVHCHVIAVLDDDQEKIGRAIRGIPVIAPPRQLDSVIEEFAVHGVPIDRVILGGDEQLLSREMLNHVLRICGQREVVLDYVPRLISLSPLRRTSRHNVPLISLRAQQELPTAFSRYFRFKRVTDFIAAFAAIIVLSPLFIVASAVILFDLGSPVLFWQQRFGQNGRHFLLYKFRTLRPPFDRHGQPIGEDQRISRIGRFLRQIRFDELPQLFNVLVGDMSLIGPRPLLLIDQPKKLNVRLAVRPGMTGWAQVNGGNLVTAEEKGALDEWYVRNASLWLDLRIALLTLRFLFTGERRSEAAVTEANASQEMRPLRASAEGRRLAASD